MNKKKVLIVIVAIIFIVEIPNINQFFEMTPFGQLPWYVLIIVGLYYWYKHHKNVIKKRQEAIENERYEKKARKQAIIQYRKNLEPSNWAWWRKVSFPSDDAQTLGQSQTAIKYMFINHNHIITFPESEYGNKVGYYLINVKFQRRTKAYFNGQGNGQENGNTNQVLNGNQSINGAVGGGGASVRSNDNPGVTYNGFGGGFTGSGNVNLQGNGNYNGSIHSNMSGSITTKEIPTYALLTFVTTDFSKSFTLRLLNVMSGDITNIQQHFELNQVQKQKIGLIH